MEIESPKPSPMAEMVLEAGRVSTAKMLDYCRRMGIRMTPLMTPAPELKTRRHRQTP